jgi:prevent-host-death family protein
MTDDDVTITEGRANLSEVVATARLQHRCIFLTQRGKRRGAVVSAELGEAIQAAGGPDAALALLNAAAGHPPDAAREGDKPWA